MSLYLPVAILFAVLLSLLCYYAFTKENPALILWGGLFMLIVLRLMTSLYPYIWNTDEGEWLSLARTLPYCSVPYKCIDAHSTGFLNILVFKSLYYLGIGYNYSSLRLFGLFVYIVPSVLLFYFTLRRLYTARTVILGMSLLFHYHMFGSDCYDLFAYHSELVLMLLTAATYYCYVRYTRDKKINSLILAALCMGLMPFFKLQSGPIIIAFTILFFIYFFKNKKFGQGLIFCAVGVLPLTITLLYLCKMGLLNDFYEMYIVSNQYLVKYFTNTGFIGKIKVFIYQQTWQFTYYLIVGILLLAAYSRKKLTWGALRKLDMPPLVLLGFAYIAFAASGQGMQHYLSMITIPLFLVITDLFSVFNMEGYVEPRIKRIGYSVYLMIAAFIILLLPQLKMFSYRVDHPRRPDSLNLVNYVNKEVPAGKPVCVLGWFDAVEIEVEINRPLATRTAHNYYLLADKDTALMHYYHQQYIADLDSSKPMLVIDPLRTISWEGGEFRELDDPRMAPILQYLQQKYIRQDSLIDSCVIYKRKEP